MLNRMAESFYWIGRYMERVDFTTRLIDVNYHSHHVLLDKENNQEYLKKRLLAAFSDHRFANQLIEIHNHELLDFLSFEHTYDNSILSCLGKARQNVRIVRGQLPEKIWDSINSFYHWLKAQGGQEGNNQLPYRFFEKIHQKVSLFNGITDSTMLRENEWNFIQAGKFIERAANSLRILQLFCDLLKEERESYHPFISIIESADGLEAFRKHYSNQIKQEEIFEFLVHNKAFPKSVFFSLTNLEMYLKIVENDIYIVRYTKLNRLLTGIKAELSAGFDLKEQTNRDLQTWLNEIHGMVNQIGMEIENCFFYEEGAEFSESSPQKKVAAV
ncbi:alpha-E domain-containing protein [Neobacillus cucumis]|nr:alpha-E domain-containing protein [Neobacillus cucumis]